MHLHDRGRDSLDFMRECMCCIPAHTCRIASGVIDVFVMIIGTGLRMTFVSLGFGSVCVGRCMHA